MTTIYFAHHQKRQLVDLFKEVSARHYLCNQERLISKVYTQIEPKVSVT